MIIPISSSHLQKRGLVYSSQESVGHVSNTGDLFQYLTSENTVSLVGKNVNVRGSWSVQENPCVQASDQPYPFTYTRCEHKRIKLES